MSIRQYTQQDLQDFLAEQQLPQQFMRLVDGWYAPLAQELWQHHLNADRPLLVGINGSQGSGKSTLASLLNLLLTQVYQLKTIDFSIDDFYLTRESRSSLAGSVHPLLATRGVPGTHDIALMGQVLRKLTQGEGEVAIPRFNKAVDDRYPVQQWQQVSAPVDVVIVEGWCLGTPAQSEDALSEPVNDLEAREDSGASWRHFVNRQIQEHYQKIYQLVDIWVMLQAPSFDCVYRWRLEQEEKLVRGLRAGDDSTTDVQGVMSAEQVHWFIQHYQRLTEHTLKRLPAAVHYLFQLDGDRQIIAARQPRQVGF